MGPIFQLAASLALLPLSTMALSWEFAEQPKQCKSVLVNVTSPGVPPYRLLVIPFGASPLSKEVRKITEQAFDGNSNTVQLSLKYPANSQFVAVLSDSTSFGSGGTTTAIQIAASDDSSCFDPNTQVAPAFTFDIEPRNQVVQCTPTRIWWDPAAVQGNPNFLGVIPGGMSFAIPQGSLSQKPSLGTGFDWTPNVRAGNTLYIVGGDSRGNGTGGSVQNTVSQSTSSDSGNCLNDQSPSSTPGTPAGAVATPTGSSGSGGNSTIPANNDNKSSPVGPIVGGVVGGIVGAVSLFLIAWFFIRKRKESKVQKERPVDLLVSDDADEDPNAPSRLPQYYEPEPFMVPDPTVASSTDGHTDYRTSFALSSSRSGTPDPYSAATSTSHSGPKKPPMRALRPVNIIQHEDAGPDAETIELPPAYTNIKPSASHQSLLTPEAGGSGSGTNAAPPPGAAGPSVPGSST
ncbi:hypothetical protein DL96DRAFT_1578732 [Flagelloscypha sp. PMI_526]|nr:hypothetical protein DL96DRAFT_1578732 [Flagelloscypha sp. PMI_526]